MPVKFNSSVYFCQMLKPNKPEREIEIRHGSWQTLEINTCSYKTIWSRKDSNVRFEGKCHPKTFWMLRSFFPSVLKVSCCNLSEGQQRYFHQHVESAALQCEFISSVESEYVAGGGILSPCVTELRLLHCGQRYFTETVPSEHAVMSIKKLCSLFFFFS